MFYIKFGHRNKSFCKKKDDLPNPTPRYRLEIPESAPSLSLHGAPIGGNRVFKITMSRRVRMFSGLSVKIKCCTAQEDGGRILFVFVSVCVVGKKLEYPNCSYMADG